MSRWCMPANPAASRPLQSTTSFAILGLLSVRSWTTYELAKQVQRSLSWFWPRAERKIYEQPKLLVADGLATSRKEYTGQRPSTVYEITDAGRDALRRWLDVTPAPRTTEFEAMLKVFFADAGSLDQLRTTIDAIEAGTADRLRELGCMAQQALDEGAMFPQRQHISASTLRLQYLQEAAVLTWARWARDQTGAWTSTTDPGKWDHRGALADMVTEVHRLV